MAWSHSRGQLAVVDFEVVVVVPRLARRRARPGRSARRARAAGGRSAAAGPASPGPYISRMCCGSRRDVERLGRLGLHPVGQLERLDAGFELRVVAGALAGAAG